MFEAAVLLKLKAMSDDALRLLMLALGLAVVFLVAWVVDLKGYALLGRDYRFWGPVSAVAAVFLALLVLTVFRIEELRHSLWQWLAACAGMLVFTYFYSRYLGNMVCDLREQRRSMGYDQGLRETLRMRRDFETRRRFERSPAGINLQGRLEALAGKYGADAACYLVPHRGYRKGEKSGHCVLLAAGRLAGELKWRHFDVPDLPPRPAMLRPTGESSELFRLFREVAVIPVERFPGRSLEGLIPEAQKGFILVGVAGEGGKIDERVIGEVEGWLGGRATGGSGRG
ncbi:hypothetical protein [Ammonifex thiophilus]|uniref:Uncharacterized protein n=1 Tax=Ammonifex thiophilus TaxID=444093 RepID=A0A3D8P2X1_9THEO|nr:hypothetical protein [Ammonifex thiophilus]RDV80904.1 hypothetical protein DXX99_10345 [Ammonifex thiophilus]